MDQAKKIPLCLQIQCVAWLWHMLPSTMMARASSSHKTFVLASFDFIRLGLVACDLFPYEVSPHKQDQATVVGCGTPVGVRAHPSPSAGMLPSLPANQPAARPPNDCLSVCHSQTPLPSQSLSQFLIDHHLQD